MSASRGLIGSDVRRFLRGRNLERTLARFSRRGQTELPSLALRGSRAFRFLGGALGPLVQQFGERIFVAILELLGLEIRGLDLTMCLAISSMSLVTFASWMSPKYSFSSRIS